MQHGHIQKASLVGVILGVLLLAATAGTATYLHRRQPAANRTPGQSADLLDGNWQYMPGASQNDRTLTVTALDRKIVEQDGSGGQPNQPVNLYGTYLSTAGDFSVTARIHAERASTATIQLYATPPVIADEFRLDPAHTAVTLHGKTMSVQIWDTRTEGSPAEREPAYNHQITLADPDSPVTISRIGDSIVVRSGGQSLIARRLGRTFDTQTVWLGFDTTDTFEVTSLRADGLNGDTIAVKDASALPITIDANGLQALAARQRPDFTVGAAVALGPLVSDADYHIQLLQNFGGITLENAMKPQFISPKQGMYTFQEADALVAFAQSRGLRIHGHTLAFSEANPSWMRQLPTGTPAERQATAAILLDYVTTVTQHFKGKFDTLDVINEPFDTDQGTGLQHNVWYKAMGPDYMVRISQAVHAADPTVKQFVNENGAELSGERQDALLKLVQSINAKGGFIYGVGLQSHVYNMSTDSINAGKLDTTISRFGAAGFRVRISENDVTDDGGTHAQANQYQAVFMTCLRNTNCISYTTWGINDRYDWFMDDDGHVEQGHDLLFDGAKPTPAYDMLMRSLT